MTDTSGSLRPELKVLSESIDKFVDELPEGIDFHIGVMYGHGSTSKWSGRLASPVFGDKKRKHRSWDADLEASTSSKAPSCHTSPKSPREIEQNLTDYLTKSKDDGASDGGEEVLYSFLRGLENDRLSESREKGFFRKNAALATVFISDENDLCYEPTKHGFFTFPHFVLDGDRAEPKAYQRDCLKNGTEWITPQTVIEKVQALMNGRPYLMNGVIYSDPSTIKKDGENAIGHGILETVQESGGVVIDLARHDFSHGLARIGELTAKKLNLKTQFKLKSDADPVPETIEVRVDGIRVPHRYFADTHVVEISIEDAGDAGSMVEVLYCKDRHRRCEYTRD